MQNDLSPKIAAPTRLQGEALVDGSGQVWLPYDLPFLGLPTEGWQGLSAHRDVRHAGRRPFAWQMPASDELHLLNGMGVTLGDSVIGLGALAWLKACHPGLRIHLYRTPHAPAFVERLYALANGLIESVTYLPLPLAALPADAVDLSDFLYWPDLARVAMVDFFLHGLGVAPDSVPASAKANRWLTGLPLPTLPAPWDKTGYVLLCDQASTALRSLPAEHAAALVERIWRQYRLPVLGFHALAHPHYADVCAHSAALDPFIAWVKSARVVVSVDSAAVHLAAGFDVPTLAVFVSIDPALRVRDYPECQALDLRSSLTDGLHASDDPAVLAQARQSWRGALSRTDWPWPAPPASPAPSN